LAWRASRRRSVATSAEELGDLGLQRRVQEQPGAKTVKATETHQIASVSAFIGSGLRREVKEVYWHPVRVVRHLFLRPFHGGAAERS